MIIHHLSCARYSLEELYLCMNQINCTLPNLSIFSSLRALYVDGNKLNGKIPKDIQFSPQLKILYLNSNSLKGVLTDYHFANMSNLDSLDLSDNSLALTFIQNWVPSFQLSKIGLRSCMLGVVGNKLSGPIPAWIGSNMQELEILSLGSNHFNGSLPLQICYLRSIQLLDLSMNNFFWASS